MAGPLDLWQGLSANRLFAGADTQLNPAPAADMEALDFFGLGAKPSYGIQPGMAPALTGGQAPVDFTLLQKLFGGALGDGTKTMGAVAPILQGVGALGNVWMGMQNYGLAKDSLKEGKRQFNMNYGAQRDSTNTLMEDRQNARVASNPNFYESTATYMDKNRIR